MSGLSASTYSCGGDGALSGGGGESAFEAFATGSTFEKNRRMPSFFSSLSSLSSSDGTDERSEESSEDMVEVEWQFDCLGRMVQRWMKSDASMEPQD
jgi:hypothetical protein